MRAKITMRSVVKLSNTARAEQGLQPRSFDLISRAAEQARDNAPEVNPEQYATPADWSGKYKVWPSDAFAARWAECVFVAYHDYDRAKIDYKLFKDKVVEAGRDPEHVAVCAGVYPVVAETRAEAEDMVAMIDKLPKEIDSLALLSEVLNFDFAKQPIDKPFTQEEIDQMLRHAWELQNIFSYYYFFTENCSYNLFYLIDRLGADAVTVSPYLGLGAIEPFLQQIGRDPRSIQSRLHFFKSCAAAAKGDSAVGGLTSDSTA